MRLAVSLAGLLVASTLAAQSAPDTQLVRTLATEVREMIRTRPGASNPFFRDENERMTDLLVRLQVQSHDLDGALTTAAALNGTPRTFQWITDRQRKTGDHAGLARTIAASHDRETLTSSVARWYISLDSLDLASVLAHTLPPSYARRELDAEVAVARAGHGDWSAIDTTPLASLTPADQVDLLTQLGDKLRQQHAPQLDSIARLADRALAMITDPDERTTASMFINMRIRNLVPAGLVRMTAQVDGVVIVSSVEIDTARSGPARVQALRNQAVQAARRDGRLDAALRILEDPLVVADTVSLAQALVDVAGVAGNSPRPVDSLFFLTLDRAEELAGRVGYSFADQTRARIVGLLASRDPVKARSVASRIRDPFQHGRARASLIRQLMTSDVKRAIDEAAALHPAGVADTLLREAAMRQIKAGALSDAVATRQRIAGPELRRFVGADIALAKRAAGRRDEAIRDLEQLLGELDPWGDFAFANRTVLPALVGLGRTQDIVTWARSKRELPGAYARMAVMVAVWSCSAGGNSC